MPSTRITRECIGLAWTICLSLAVRVATHSRSRTSNPFLPLDPLKLGTSTLNDSLLLHRKRVNNVKIPVCQTTSKHTTWYRDLRACQHRYRTWSQYHIISCYKWYNVWYYQSRSNWWHDYNELQFHWEAQANCGITMKSAGLHEITWPQRSHSGIFCLLFVQGLGSIIYCRKIPQLSWSISRQKKNGQPNNLRLTQSVSLKYTCMPKIMIPA